MSRKIKLCSWNVNGIRAAVKNGFNDFLEKEKPDIVGLQEIKIGREAITEAQFDFKKYQEFWNSADRPGYSGTATLTKLSPLQTLNGINLPEFDSEGRVQTLGFEDFYFVNTYFPNANHELSRLGYKEKFNKEWLKYVKELEVEKPVVTCGDFNVAHQEIDLARPKDNVGNAGFTKEERYWADKFEEAGLVDTFRYLHPEKIQYSWWSYRNFARARNVGWRIDYFLVSKSLAPKLKEAFIRDQITGSDHAPVGIVLDL